MMESLRNAAKSWVAKALIFMLAASFGVWGIADVFTGYRAGALATVGREEVSAEEFNQAFNRALQQLAQQSGQAFTPEDARKLGIDRNILNNLIQSAAIDDLGKRMKLAVGDAQIVKETQANPSFHDASGKFSQTEFLGLLEANGMNEQIYLARERQAKLRAAVTDSVDGDFAASKTLIEATYRHSNEQRDARYFVIKTADGEVGLPGDDEIKKHYEDQPAAYTAPEYRSLATMTADPGVVAARIALTDADMTAGYEKYKLDYFTPEKRTVLQLTFASLDEAQKAKERISGGVDFLALAKERGVSAADATFADQARSDFFDPAVADAAFKLAEGGVSDPVKGSLATSLLKVTKISPEYQKTLEEVKDELEQRLKLERAREEIQSVYDAVEDARAAQTKFEDIAAKAGIPFKLTGLIDATGRDKDGKDIELPQKTEVLKAAFASDVGVENDALSQEDSYLWYEVREVVPSAVKPFDQVREQVKSDIIAGKVRELALEKAKKLVERARGGAALEELAKENGVEILNAQGLKRNETNAEFSSEAVSALFAVAADGFAYAPEGDGKGARVMLSQAVLLPPFDGKSEEAKTIATSLQSGSANDLLSAYLSTLQKEAGVSINETLWRQISGTLTQ